MMHFDKRPGKAVGRSRTVFAWAAYLGLLGGAALAAESAPRSPVYRLTERFVAESGAADVPVFARASAPHQLVVQEGGWAGLVDFEAARVDWYAIGAGAGDTELRLPPHGEHSSSGSVWLEQGAADFLSPTGGRLRLGPRPPVRGALTTDALRAALPAWAAASRAHRVDPRWADELRSSAERLPDGTSLEVFFGSWCSACEAYVPRLLSAAELLDIPIRWVGVAPTAGSVRDPLVVDLDIRRLPTVVVLGARQEAGRIDRIDALRRPERALARLFSALASSR